MLQQIAAVILLVSGQLTALQSRAWLQLWITTLGPIRAMGWQQQDFFFFFFFFFFSSFFIFLQNNKIQYTDLKLKKLHTRTLKESQTKDSKLKDTDL